MIQDLDKFLFSFFYSNKTFLSRYIADCEEKWIDENYSNLFKVLKDYYLKHGEVASKNIIEEKISNNEDVLTYKSFIADAKTLKVEDSDFPNLIEKIKQRYNKEIINRTINDIRLDLESEANIEGVNNKIQKTANEIERIYRTHAYKEGTLQQTARETYEQYLEEEKNPDTVKGVFTKIKEVDERLNGLRPPDLMLVAGESGTGKSILCMNIALNMWLGSNKIEDYDKNYKFKDDGCNILFFSIEMDYDEMRTRIDANLAGVDFIRLRDRKLEEDERLRFRKSCVFQSKYNKQIFITDIPRGINIMDIKAKYEEILQVFNPDVIVVDHLGLMSPLEKKGQDWLEQGDIAADLHEFNRRNRKITIAAVQANRPKDKAKASYGTNRIGRSEMIPQNASIILHIANREDEETFSDMPIHITKLRHGPKGKFSLYKQFEIMRAIGMEDVDKININIDREEEE